MKNKSIAAMLLALAIAGCDGVAHVFEKPKTLVVSVAADADVAVAQKVLSSRFEQNRVSRHAELLSETKDRTIRFTFKRRAPPRDLAERLVQQPGHFTFGLETGPAWITEKDVQSAAAIVASDGGPAIAVRVTDDASTRLGDYTEANVGKLAFVRLDGQSLVGALVQRRFGQEFQFPLPKFNLDQTRYFASIINSGPLPSGITVVTNDLTNGR